MYQKKFWVFNREETGYENDNRLVTVLGKLNLQDCIYRGQGYKLPNYKTALEIIESERNKFKSYLIESFQE